MPTSVSPIISVGPHMRHKTFIQLSIGLLLFLTQWLSDWLSTTSWGQRERAGFPCSLSYGLASGAEGGIRTHTPFRIEDFKSAASTIPPPRLVSLEKQFYQWASDNGNVRTPEVILKSC